MRIASAAPVTVPTAEERAVQDARILCELVSANVEAAAEAPERAELSAILSDIKLATDQLSNVLAALANAIKRQ